MASAHAVPRLTPAEYLAWEAEQAVRYEYVNGEVVAMSGVSPAHNRITSNLHVALAVGLRGGPCRVNMPDLRILVDETGLYAYPDLTIVCGPPDYTEDPVPSLRNPRVVVEVLSDSTANHDLGAKAAHYRRRASVQTLLLVDSRARRVQRQERNPDGTWTLADLTEGDVTVAGVVLTFDEIYADVEVDG